MATIVKLSDLQSALRRTLPAVSTDEKRPILQCVHFVQTSQNLRIESADGFRAAIVTLPHGDNGATWEYIIPAKHLQPLLKLKDGKKEPVYVTLTATPGALDVNGQSFPQLDPELGRYPDINMVVPLTNRAWFNGTLPADFAKGANLMAAFAKHATVCWCNWTPSAAGHVLIIRDEEIGSSRYDMAADVTCHKYPASTYGINTRFLKEMCNAADKTPVTFYLSAPNAPLRFDFDNTVYVIMPMHTDRQDDVTPFDWQTPVNPDITPAYNPPAFNYCEYIRNNEYCQVKHDATPGKVNNFYMRNDTFAPAVPLPGAVESEIEYIDAYATHPTYGKGELCAKLKFAILRPIVQTVKRDITKSERMTWLNKERADIRRRYKYAPETCAKLLHNLYRAFGCAQSKHPEQYDAPTQSAVIVNLGAWVIDYRAAHDITPLVTGQVSTCTPVTCITA